MVSRVHAIELDDHAHQEGDGRSSPLCAARASKAVCHDMPGHVSSAWYVLDPSDYLVDGEIEPDPMLLDFEHRNQHRKRAFGSASLNGGHTLRTSSPLLHWRTLIPSFSLTETLAVSLTVLHRRESAHPQSAQLTRRIQSRPTRRVFVLRPDDSDYSDCVLSDTIRPDGVPSRQRNRGAGMEAEKPRVNIMKGVLCIVLNSPQWLVH